MPYTRLSGVADSLFKLGELRRQRQEDAFGRASDLAALHQAGYDIQQQPGRFGGMFGGGMTITPIPGYINKAQLEQKKLAAEIEDLQAKSELRQKFGQVGGVPEGMLYDPLSQSLKPDPTYVNPIQQSTIQSRQSIIDARNIKRQEAEQADLEKERMLREQAQGMLSNIQAAREGSKFFGPLGGMSSKFAPSSFLGIGNYPERSKWESNVNRLLSQKVLDIMNEMKQASRTGATGFGQLSEKELQVLKEASTVLNRELAPEDAVYYLNQMERLYQKALNGGVEQGQFGQIQQPVPQKSKYEILQVE